MLKEVMVREGSIMDVRINPGVEYPNIMFEFSLDGQVYVYLWIRIGRSGLNNDNNYIMVEEIQGVKTKKNYYNELKKKMGIHPFSLAVLSLIQAVQQLRNHRWEIVRTNGIGFYSQLIAEKYFDREQAVNQSTGYPLIIKIDEPEAWEGYSKQDPLYRLKGENKTMRRALRGLDKLKGN